MGNAACQYLSLARDDVQMGFGIESCSRFSDTWIMFFCLWHGKAPAAYSLRCLLWFKSLLLCHDLGCRSLAAASGMGIWFLDKSFEGDSFFCNTCVHNFLYGISADGLSSGE